MERAEKAENLSAQTKVQLQNTSINEGEQTKMRVSDSSQILTFVSNAFIVFTLHLFSYLSFLCEYLKCPVT